MYHTTTQNKHKKLKPGSATSYDIQPGNGHGLFWYRCFINLSLTYLLRHLSTYLQPRDQQQQGDRQMSRRWKVTNWRGLLISISATYRNKSDKYQVPCYSVINMSLSYLLDLSFLHQEKETKNAA